MKKPTLEVVPRILRPRYEGGTDYSSQRVVLVRVQDAAGVIVRELRWQFAGHCWVSMMEPNASFPASLELVTFSPPRGASRTPEEHEITLHEGGRLSRKLLLADGRARQFSKEFGGAATQRLTTLDLFRETLVVRLPP